MFRRLGFLLLNLAMVLVVAGPIQARSSEPSQTGQSTQYWDVAYWNNTSLSGDPAVVTTDADLDHDWGMGSPHTGVNADQFSASWTRSIDVTGGKYRFTALSDDGIRIYVDDELIIDQWYEHPRLRFITDAELTSGQHLITVEYYENQGDALVKLSWEVAASPPSVWNGEYYDNRWFNGSPFRNNSNILDFNWGYNSPAPSIPSDGFSARWWRTVYFNAGVYRFVASSDDGIRVYVDGQVIVDGWYDHPARTFAGEIDLKEGEHHVAVEYYENTGVALVNLTWGLASIPSDGWNGEYFNNVSLSGTPLLIRKDAEIDFDWGERSPAREIWGDRFSARWTRLVHLDPGVYRFTATTDDGVRLWANNDLLIDYWRDQAATSRSGTINLEGDVVLKMEYYENSGLASAQLTWERVGENPPPVTDGIVVDDTDAGFVKGGPASEWGTAAEGYGGYLTWAWNKAWVTRYHWPGYNWGRWYPTLAPGGYEVFVYIPERYTTSTVARYWIKHRDGFTLRVVNQSANGNRWVSLGTYTFNGDGEEYVSLATPTYEGQRSSLLAFDAVKWVPR